MNIQAIRRRITQLTIFFMAALAVSGITAIPLRWESDLLQQWFGQGTWMQAFWPAMAAWITFVNTGIQQTFSMYPFLQYGTDWLAFAHVIIAAAFIGVLRDPVRNRWVVEWSMLACLLLIPTALIFGPLRDIPFFWRLFDCAFGVFGLPPLWLLRRYILLLERAD